MNIKPLSIICIPFPWASKGPPTKTKKRREEKPISSELPGHLLLHYGSTKVPPPKQQLSRPEGFPPLFPCRALSPLLWPVPFPLAWGWFIAQSAMPTWTDDWTSCSLGADVINPLLFFPCWILQLADCELSFVSVSPWPRAWLLPTGISAHPLYYKLLVLSCPSGASLDRQGLHHPVHLSTSRYQDWFVNPMPTAGSFLTVGNCCLLWAPKFQAFKAPCCLSFSGPLFSITGLDPLLHAP